MVQIENAFLTENVSVYEFYQKPGVGFYIPLYQREYSWDSENIEQLLTDISKGIESLIESDDEIRFLGTIITVTEKNPANIEPLDRAGLPPSVHKVIDGQQRLSTIALLASALHKVLGEERNNLPKSNEIVYEELTEIINIWQEKLEDIFSFDLKRGIPKRKPKLVRGSKDKWVKTGDVEINYLSDLSNYLGRFIESIYSNKTMAKLGKSQVDKNLSLIYKWLNKDVLTAQINNADDFPSAQNIIKSINERHLWEYQRPILTELINNADYSNKRSLEYKTASLIQVFSVCHYLLDRCCFTSIQPTNDKWAFDMFQSLNATGTPLTAIETFKPLVLNVTKKIEGNFENSVTKQNFDKIENLFVGIRSANKKNQLTNELLTSFSNVVTGKGVSSHFSHQRNWLDSTYMNLSKDQKEQTYQKQCDYIEYFGYYAQFYKEVWLDYSGSNNIPLEKIKTSKEAELASTLILYLKDSNHKMAITILAQFYMDVIKGEENSIDTFVNACKLIASFYTTWRAAKSNSGLDNVYRNIFRGYHDEDSGFKLPAHAWLKRDFKFNLNTLKEYFNHILEKQNITLNKRNWIEQSKKYCTYKNTKKICRFILFLSSDETIPDNDHIGLMKQGTVGTTRYLTIAKWNSKGLKTIEHIAPQSNNGAWDSELYEESSYIHTLGNLTLLPIAINASASNKQWREKLLYYKHLNEEDPTKLMELASKAKAEGIFLADDTIKILQNSNYNDHISSIVKYGKKYDWNLQIVEKRTERILSLFWDKTNQWL